MTLWAGLATLGFYVQFCNATISLQEARLYLVESERNPVLVHVWYFTVALGCLVPKTL